MMMTGHKTRSIFESYNITSGSDLREASAKLSSLTDAVLAGALASNLETETALTSLQAAPKIARDDLSDQGPSAVSY